MDIDIILESHKLKKTSARVKMLKVFMDYDHALSAKEIIHHMKKTHNRVTIYRTLTSFEKYGILHRASEDINGIRYALCNNKCPEKPHTDEHIHLICDKCSQTYCLDDIKIPKIKVLEKFLVKRLSYTINGVCSTCLSN